MKRTRNFLPYLLLVIITLMFAGCGGDNNAPAPAATTGTITADATGTVAAGTTVSPPPGVTSMTFNSPSVLTDATSAPVTGAITTTVTRSTSASSLPAAAPTGTSLAVLLDINMTKGATVVKNLSTPLTVVVAVPSGVTSVNVYSFNGTSWVLEQTGVAISGGNATISVTHLSFWGCFSVNPLTISTTSPLTAGTVGTAYSLTFAAAGGTAPYGWTVTAGTLPAGLTLSTAGVLSGTPTTAATSTFTVTVTDSATPANTASLPCSLTIAAAGAPLTITTTSPLTAGTVGTAYSLTFAATGGTAPYSWAVTAGTVPAGLTLSTAGVLSGTPTTAATSTFTVTVTDAAAATAPLSCSLTVAAAGNPLVITTTSPLPAATFGTAYTQTLVATGGLGAYTWAVTVGPLPTGLLLNTTTGVISGTPTAPAIPNATISNFTIGVTGAVSGSTTSPFAITSSLSASAASGRSIYDTNCAGCHQLGIYDTNGGSPNLGGGVGTANVSTRFPAGTSTTHNGLTITFSATQITNLIDFFSLY